MKYFDIIYLSRLGSYVRDVLVVISAGTSFDDRTLRERDSLWGEKMERGTRSGDDHFCLLSGSVAVFSVWDSRCADSAVMKAGMIYIIPWDPHF